jgi:hypothetical protein
VNGSGAKGGCLTSAAAARKTGEGESGCASLWGAEDMIGNVGEMTDEWLAGVGDASFQNPITSVWSTTDYGGDATMNLISGAREIVGGTNTAVPGLPAIARRGGAYFEGLAAGVFELNALAAPSHYGPATGFRCVVAM